MTDKEKAAREWASDVHPYGDEKKPYSNMTLTQCVREAFLAGAGWVEKNVPCPSCADAFDAGVLMEAEYTPKWIKCSERLPEVWGEYLVSIKNHRIEIAMFSSVWCLSGCDGAGLEDDIIYWMPLPEAPKEEES